MGLSKYHTGAIGQVSVRLIEGQTGMLCRVSAFLLLREVKQREVNVWGALDFRRSDA